MASNNVLNAVNPDIRVEYDNVFPEIDMLLYGSVPLNTEQADVIMMVGIINMFNQVDV